MFSSSVNTNSIITKISCFTRVDTPMEKQTVWNCLFWVMDAFQMDLLPETAALG